MTNEVRKIPGVAGAILAGGRARRFDGVNKGALRIGRQTILDRQVALLREIADPVFVVSSRPDVIDEVTEGGVMLVRDAFSGAGPLGGIYSAIAASPRERTLVVACDMPFVNRSLLRRLARRTTADVVIPRSTAGYEPLCAAWSAACAEPIRRRIERGQLKAALAMEELRVEEIGPEELAACDPHGLLFVNVNTPHDYERARELNRTARGSE